MPEISVASDQIMGMPGFHKITQYESTKMVYGESLMRTIWTDDWDGNIYQAIPLKYILLFCGYVFFWYVEIVGRIPFLASIRFEFIYAASLSCIVLALLPKNNIHHPLQNYVVCFFIVAAIQVPFSYDYQTSQRVFIDRFVKLSFMAWFIGAFVRSPNGMRFFLVAFFMACMKLGQEGLLGQLTGSLVWENQGVMRLHGPTPRYGHPNSFTGMALGTVPFIFCLFPIVSKKVKLVLVVALIFAVNIILFTGSRTGYAAFFLLLVAFVWKSKSRFKVIIFFVIAAAISLQYIPDQYVGRFNSMFSGKDKEGRSSDLRKEILRDSVDVFIAHPFGVGVGAFPAVRKATFGREQDTHNLYLEVATNLGVQGLIVFALFITSMLRLLSKIERRFRVIVNAVKMRQEKKELVESEVRLLADSEFLEATTRAVILFLCARLGLGLFGMDLYEIYWWFALGLSGALFRICHYTEVAFERLAIIK